MYNVRRFRNCFYNLYHEIKALKVIQTVDKKGNVLKFRFPTKRQMCMFILIVFSGVSMYKICFLQCILNTYISNSGDLLLLSCLLHLILHAMDMIGDIRQNKNIFERYVNYSHAQQQKQNSATPCRTRQDKYMICISYLTRIVIRKIGKSL